MTEKRARFALICLCVLPVWIILRRPWKRPAGHEIALGLFVAYIVSLLTMALEGNWTAYRFACQEKTGSLNMKDGMIYMEVADILPQDLDQQITVTVTDGNGLYLILFHQLGELACRDAMLALGRMRIDGFVVQEITLCIEAHHLTSSAVSWVDTHYTLLSQRWSQKQLAKIPGKHTDGLFVGLFLAEGCKLRFDARLQESLVSISNSLLHL